MPFGKKRKIQKYLEVHHASGTMTPFDALLEDALSGRMKQKTEAIDVKKIAIYIDWLPEYQCINLSGVHRRNQLDLQIEPSAFHIMRSRRAG